MNIFKIGSTISVFLSFAVFSNAQIIEKKSLTMDGARQVIAAAVTEANNKKTTGVIAVVDEGGNLMVLERIDGTFAAGAKAFEAGLPPVTYFPNDEVKAAF